VADDKTAITTLLRAYETALNASSASAILSLYAPDGVFMAQSFPTAVGRSSIREAYDRIFAAITLSVEFDIIEVVLVSEAWAFARTASKGTTVVKAGGGIKEANQELFVLRRVDGDWKIAMYCFCTTNPPQ
jgi:uncharacterized protein (TIGR02246 family)